MVGDGFELIANNGGNKPFSRLWKSAVAPSVAPKRVRWGGSGTRWRSFYQASLTG